jgi:hypothetical protein
MRSEFSVDAVHECEQFVVSEIGVTHYGLHKHNFFTILWIVEEELPKGLQFETEASKVTESIDGTDDDAVLTKLPLKNPGTRKRFFDRRFKQLGLN